MSLQVFTLPDLGEGLAEAELLRWLVAVGDTVRVDQPVVEVETAKATVEIPSPYGGVVATLHGDQGAVVNVGEPLLSVDDEVGTAPSTQPSAAPLPQPPPAHPRSARPPPPTSRRSGRAPATCSSGTAPRRRPRSAGAGAVAAPPRTRLPRHPDRYLASRPV